jgi:capsular exopolysaccharide synthesis family protein
LIVGVGATFVDGRLRSMSEARQATGLSVLAVVPHMPSTLTPATRGRKFQLDPTSDVADAYRAIRSAIYLRARGKTILVTSPSRGEGKSTVASNLAIALAEGGQKVLLIDADMREPVQHRTFATSADTGISSIVAGRAALQRAAQSTPTKGLELLPCGPVPFNAAETINNQAFADMLAEINARYDYVVLDSPPANAVTDARILAAMCDVTLLVVRRSRTSRRAAIDARDGLLGFGANLLGLIVNDGPRHGQQSMDMPAPRRGVDKANDPTPAPATGSASATAGAASAARPGNRLPSAAASMMARPRR